MADSAEIIKSNPALEQLQVKLQGLKDRAESLEIKDGDGIILAKNLKLDIQSYLKAVKFQTGPEIEIAKEHLRKLQAQETMLLTPGNQILEISEKKRKDWENEERRLAQIETDRINAENARLAREKAEAERRESERIAKEAREAREKELEAQRKAGEIGKREEARLAKVAAEEEAKAKAAAAEQAEKTAAEVAKVTVKPNIPAVQGTVSRQNWKFRIAHPHLIPITYRMPDEVAIGRMVRDMKDKAKAEAQCPGIEVWSE
jgi:hypothetical protein